MKTSSKNVNKNLVCKNICKYEHPREYINDQNFNSKPLSQGLVYVNGKIEEQDIKILIDTGSEASMIKETLIETCKLQDYIIKVPKITLLNANGRKICDTNRSVATSIMLKGTKMDTQLLVIKNLSNDVILGTDELHRHEIMVDYQEKELRIQGNKIEFVEQNENKESHDREVMCMKNNDDLMYKNDNLKNSINRSYKNNMKMNRGDNYEDIENIVCKEEYKEEVKKLIMKYRELVTKENRIAKNYVHTLEVKEIGNFKAKTYPIPYKYKEQVNEEISEMLKKGIIEKSNTRYINPMVIVKKANGELRLCLDARNINRCTVPQYESPMSIDAILGRITEAKWFTKMDLKHSFWLIPLDENSRNYTGFMINGVIFRFKVVAYGLQSACSALVKAIHQILDKYEHFVLHYIDDILIYSKNEQDHMQHINIVLQELNEAGLKINPEKCQFYQEEVVFLGYKLTRSGVEMDESRIKSIMEYKRPTNLRTLRGFLGLVNYFKRLIPDLSEKTITLVELLRKGTRWNWTAEREKAFVELRNKFSDNLKIYHPRYDLPFLLRTDASMNKFAGVLLQKVDDKEIPIYFISRITKSYEKNYNATELELASIVFCINKLRFYLLGAKFYIETDHKALVTIMNNRYANNRIHRWLLLLQEYDFEVKHIPGKSNMIDSLTREDGKVEREHRKFRVGVNIIKDEHGLYSLRRITEDQRNLSEREKSKCEMDNGIYFKRTGELELYVVTGVLGKEILEDLHNKYGHIGARKTLLIFRENYITKGDSAIAKSVTSKCEVCQVNKSKNRLNKYQVRSITAKNCMEIVAIDFLSELVPTTNGNKHILVMVDIFSKYVKLYPCKRTNYEEITRHMRTYFQEVGKPQVCILDNATYFQSDRFQAFCKKHNITLNFTSIRHPTANPAERYIQEVIKFLRITCEQDHTQWENNLPQVESFMNNVPNINTEESPIFLLRGEQPERKWNKEIHDTFEQIKEQVRQRVARKAQKYVRKQQKLIRKRVRFKKGDLVIIKALQVADRENQKCAKLRYKFEGPYEIVTENPVNSYKLKHRNSDLIRGIFNIQDIYKYYE